MAEKKLEEVTLYITLKVEDLKTVVNCLGHGNPTHIEEDIVRHLVEYSKIVLERRKKDKAQADQEKKQMELLAKYW